LAAFGFVAALLAAVAFSAACCAGSGGTRKAGDPGDLYRKGIGVARSGGEEGCARLSWYRTVTIRVVGAELTSGRRRG
jgi:hypothetical protein